MSHYFRQACRILLGFFALGILGCGSSGESNSNQIAGPAPAASSSSPASAPPLIPMLISGVSSRRGIVDLEWTPSEAGVSYEVHVGTSEEFQTSTATQVVVVESGAKATVEGLATDRSAYFKVIAYRSDSQRVGGISALRVQPVSKSLVPRNGLTINRDTDVGLQAIRMQWPELQMLKLTNYVAPTAGSYLHGEIASGDINKYFARVSSIIETATEITVLFEAPDFAELFTDGSVSFSIRAPAPLTEKDASANDLNYSRRQLLASKPLAEDIECGTNAVAKISPTAFKLNAVDFDPIYSGKVGYSDAREQVGFITLSLGGRVQASAALDTTATAAVAARCKVLIKAFATRWVTLTTPIPGLLLHFGAKPKIEGRLSLTASAPLEIRFDQKIDAVAKVNASFTSDGPPTSSTDGSYFNGPVKPTIVRPPDDVKLTASAEVRFAVDGLFAPGIKIEILTFKVGSLYFGGNLGVTAEFEKTKGFVKKYQEVQMKKGAVELIPTGGVDLEVNAKIAKLLKISGTVNFPFSLGDPINLFKVPDFKIEKSLEITAADLISIQGVLTATEVGGTILGFDKKMMESPSLRWYFDPMPNAVNPTPNDGEAKIAYVKSGQGCAAFSAVDSIFGESGRRFSPAIRIAVGEPTILNFQKQNDKILIDTLPYLLANSVANPNGDPSNSLFFLSQFAPYKDYLGRDVLVNSALGYSVSNNLVPGFDLKRSDGKPFDLLSIRIGLATGYIGSRSFTVFGFRQDGTRVVKTLDLPLISGNIESILAGESGADYANPKLFKVLKKEENNIASSVFEENSFSGVVRVFIQAADNNLPVSVVVIDDIYVRESCDVE